MKVFTFFSNVPGKNADEEKALIELWKETWQQQGWEPTVLDETSVPDSPENRKRIAHFRKLPSRNKQNLDLWCYLRWLAVAEQGGGFMSDYDVINYSFAPREPGKLTTFDRWIPCLVGGTRDEFLRVVDWFQQERPGLLDRWKGMHISDMLILQAHRGEFIEKNECVEYDLEGWKSAPAVHYSNRGMKRDGYTPRHLHIPELRNFPADV